MRGDNMDTLRRLWEHRKPRELESVLQELVESLKEFLGRDLRAIVLYGSAASGEYLPTKSNINILVIATVFEASHWRKLQPLMRTWSRRRIGVPFVLTESELREWARSFPIEFLDIQANHRVLMGEDIVLALPVDHTWLRWQCESELRGKLLHLRQAFIVGLKGATVGQLLERSLTSLLPIFRALLKLKGQTPPTKKHDLIRALSEAFQISGEVFEKILQVKEGRHGWSRQKPTVAFEQYLMTIEQLVTAVDALEKAVRA